METTIKQTIVKTTEQAETGNAVYNLEVQKQNGTLIAVSANVRSQERAIGADGIATISVKTKGTITYSNGKVSFAGFPLDEMLPTYATEFNEIVAHIQERED